MLLVNTDYITGKNFEMIGMVRGTRSEERRVGKECL